MSKRSSELSVETTTPDHLIDDTYLDTVVTATKWEQRQLPLRIADASCCGLRIIIRAGGSVTFHVQYTVRGRNRRPMIMLGEYPTMAIDEARALTRTIVELGKIGINVEDGLHKRLIRELQEQNTAWRA